MLVVAKDGSGDFSRITDAIVFLEEKAKEGREEQKPEKPTIFIKRGTYREKVEIKIPHLTLIGENPENTRILNDDYAYMLMEDGRKRGTFRSYTLFLDADDLTIVNLTVENTSGTGPDIGQAVAVYADGDRLIMENCRLLAATDTLFTGPLPPYELKKNGFVGPKQFAERRNGRHLYRDCYIAGDVDFIFGSATAYFEHCEIYSKNRDLPVNSYITAASTAQGQEYGYVFERCRFTSDCPQKTAYLGRPWRNYAKTVILHSYLGAHICSEGWHNWDKPEAEETVFYAEFENYGPGADKGGREKWTRQLSGTEAEKYGKIQVLSGTDGWLT